MNKCKLKFINNLITPKPLLTLNDLQTGEFKWVFKTKKDIKNFLVDYHSVDYCDGDTEGVPPIHTLTLPDLLHMFDWKIFNLNSSIRLTLK